jgi:FkbM family methyltransferase
MARPRFDLIPGTQTCGIVESRHGFMIYPRNDGVVSRILGIYGEWSQGEVDLFAQYVRPGDTVIEVGAHIGCHTVPLAQMVGGNGRVIAFEAQDFLFRILASNLLLNRLPQAVAQLAAVSDQSGEIAVPVFDYTEDKNYGALSVQRPDIFNCAPLSTAMRTMVSLDGFGFDACRILKIDAEGMETPENSEILRQLLCDSGYEAWWHHVPIYNPDNFAGLPCDLINQEGRYLVSANLVAIHKAASEPRPTRLDRFI